MVNWDPNRIQAVVGGVSHVKQAERQAPPSSEAKTSGTSFQAELERTKARKPAGEVHVSAHAAQRLLDRGITLDQADLNKISDAFDRAGAKGAKDSLFMLRDLALVVSVENRTVITALQGEHARDNVFTQIDSAVVL